MRAVPMLAHPPAARMRARPLAGQTHVRPPVPARVSQGENFWIVGLPEKAADSLQPFRASPDLPTHEVGNFPIGKARQAPAPAVDATGARHTRFKPSVRIIDHQTHLVKLGWTHPFEF